MKNELMRHMKEVENYPVFSNRYFELIRSIPLTPDLYALHRANFFFRTMATVIGIAHICAAAAQHHDQDTLILFSYILNEECGEVDKACCHERLMEQSHNLFGECEFDLMPLRVRELESGHDHVLNEAVASLVIEETHLYRRTIDELLRKNYPTMLGVAYALETHASIMLTQCREMFRLNRRQMDEKIFKRKVEVYFNCHLENGVEDRHASDAQQCILKNCMSASDLVDIRHGIDATLGVQLAMWNGMYRRAMHILNQQPYSMVT